MSFTNPTLFLVNCFLLPCLSFFNDKLPQLFENRFHRASILCGQPPSLPRTKLENLLTQILRQPIHQTVDTIEGRESSFCDKRLRNRGVLEDINVEIESGRVLDEFIEFSSRIFRLVVLPIEVLETRAKCDPILGSKAI